MVKRSAALDAAFHALAHPTRRAMLEMLADGVEHTVTELAAPFSASLAACSKHLVVLEKAKLIQRRVVGRTHVCRLNPDPLETIVDWTAELRETWDRNFQQLDAVLESLQTKKRKKR